MVTPEQMKQYKEEGYIIFDRFIDEAEIDEIRVRLDEHDGAKEKKLAESGKQGISIPKEINFTSKISTRDPEVQRFACQEKFALLAVELLETPNTQLYWDQTVYKRPEASRDFPWHQDNGYVPTEPVHYLTCWLALEETTIENGCIWVQPRTHKLGLVEHKKTETGWQCYFGDDPGIPVPLKKGGMAAFHSLLFHRSTPNLSKTQTRKGYVLQYSQAGAKNPVTGVVFDNGPVIAEGGRWIYNG
jgi:ectoine hydroxylase-related dioxygenase (phytanoyl-CoA dioxygenase family)